jgi:hypothetical protein
MSDDTLLDDSQKKLLLRHMEELERYRSGRVAIEAKYQHIIDIFQTGLDKIDEKLLKFRVVANRRTPELKAEEKTLHRHRRRIEKCLRVQHDARRNALHAYDSTHKLAEPDKTPAELAAWIRYQIEWITRGLRRNLSYTEIGRKMMTENPGKFWFFTESGEGILMSCEKAILDLAHEAFRRSCEFGRFLPSITERLIGHVDPNDRLNAIAALFDRISREISVDLSEQVEVDSRVGDNLPEDLASLVNGERPDDESDGLESIAEQTPGYLGLILDQEKREVRRQGMSNILELNNLDFELLKVFVDGCGRYLSENQLKTAWSNANCDDNPYNNRIIGAVSQLRQKILPLGVLIKTKKGLGRRLEEQTEQAN